MSERESALRADTRSAPELDKAGPDNPTAKGRSEHSVTARQANPASAAAKREEDSGIRLLRAMARAHRALAEHNEDGPEGWRKEVGELAAGTRTVADDFDAIADELIASRAALLAARRENEAIVEACAALLDKRAATKEADGNLAAWNECTNCASVLRRNAPSRRSSP